MRIGILTFHGAHNYGSVLQAYALSAWLKDQGHDVQIINLRNRAQKEAYRIYKHRSFTLRHAVDIAFTTLTYIPRKRRFDSFEYFINNYLPITKQEYTSGQELKLTSLDFDAFIAGSDQVWNPACQDFESAYYLDFVGNDKLRIGYAPSLGKEDFLQADKDLIKTLLRNVDYISCREARGTQLLQSLTTRHVEHVCDPVLLLEQSKWEEFATTPSGDEPYILTYFLNNNHGDRSQVEYLRDLTGYKVVALNEYIRDWLNPNISLKLDCTPQEFVGLIKNASIVLTNSFHASVFSVIFKKRFYTAIASKSDVLNNNDSRKIDFLSELGLESQLLPNGTHPDLDIEIDYQKAYNSLDVFRQKSIRFLEDSLRNE